MHVMNYEYLFLVSTLTALGLHFYGLYICFLLNAIIRSPLCTLIL